MKENKVCSCASDQSENRPKQWHVESSTRKIWHAKFKTIQLNMKYFYNKNQDGMFDIFFYWQNHKCKLKPIWYFLNFRHKYGCCPGNLVGDRFTQIGLQKDCCPAQNNIIIQDYFSK